MKNPVLTKKLFALVPYGEGKINVSLFFDK